MDIFLFLSSIFCAFLPLTTIFALTPYISRKGTCFGVMLMEDAQKSYKIKKIKRDYSVAVIVSGLFFTAVSIITLNYNAFVLSLVGYCIVGLALYITSNLAVRNIVMTEDWENLQKEIGTKYIPYANKKSVISMFWYAFYLPLVAYSWYISLKSGMEYSFVIPSVPSAIGVMMLIFHFTIKNSGQYVNKKNFERSASENMRLRRRWSVFVFFAGFITLVMLFILQLGFLGIIENKAFVTATPFVFTIGVTAATVAFAIANNKS